MCSPRWSHRPRVFFSPPLFIPNLRQPRPVLESAQAAWRTAIWITWAPCVRRPSFSVIDRQAVLFLRRLPSAPSSAAGPVEAGRLLRWAFARGRGLVGGGGRFGREKTACAGRGETLHFRGPPLWLGPLPLKCCCFPRHVVDVGLFSLCGFIAAPFPFLFFLLSDAFGFVNATRQAKVCWLNSFYKPSFCANP